ncbi:unnamed protein product [Meganyctiphanes norvegica]|uniref:C-type lectin domain-containing protein n=1 Tax=Meganyctiphanes norvegica TaxID=48144 RepID=A0AAV2S3P8_MEGNR
MDLYIQWIISRCWIILSIVLLVPRARAGELARIIRQARSCTDAATCAGITSATCSFPAVFSDCPVLCEDPACQTSASQTTGTCVDGTTCAGLTAASCSFPAILADCPVLCDNCPKTLTGCQSGFELVDVQCLKFSKRAKTWTDATATCENVNATLVTPSNFDALVKYIIINNLFYNQYWVGASNQVTGTYQWLDGTDVDDSLWYNGYEQPAFSNFGNDSCVKLHLQAYSSGLIAGHDTTCSGTDELNFICQEE